MNTTTRIRISLRVLFLMLGLSVWVGCVDKKKETHDEYTCPMHPTVIQDKPGRCPVCGMNLVKKKTSEKSKTSSTPARGEHVHQLAKNSVKTVRPLPNLKTTTFEANGILTVDTRSLISIPARFGGRIERLYLKYDFQPVLKGEKMLEIYSPELLTAQQDLLYLVRSDKENELLFQQAKEKLKFWGMSPQQIDELVSSGEPANPIVVYSPVSGYLQGANESELKEGMYLQQGQTIFRIANTGTLWADFDLEPEEASTVKLYDPIIILLKDEQKINARVDFLQPYIREGESFTRARAYLFNSQNKFRPGQLVTAIFSRQSDDSLWLPSTAVLDLGTRKIAFVGNNGVFKPVAISATSRADGLTKITSGLNAGDSVAVSAGFMVDSDALIRVENRK